MIRSVQIIRLSSLGDVVLCEPAVAGARAAFPDAALHVVTRPRYADVFAAHPGVTSVLSPAEAAAASAPDLAIDLHNRWSTRRLAGRAPRVVRWQKRTLADVPRALMGRPLHRSYRGGPHQVTRIREALEQHFPLPERPPRVHLHPAWARPAPVDVALLPAASRAVKAWPIRHFAQLARALLDEGLVVTALVGPGEDDVAAALRALAPGLRVWPCDLAVGPAAAHLAAARVVVGNDTGLLHLASAVGRPVVGLFGPTPPGRWGPLDPAARVLSLDARCAPCSDFGARACRFQRRVCLEDLTPAVVCSATIQSLAATTPGDPARRCEIFA